MGYMIILQLKLELKFALQELTSFVNTPQTVPVDASYARVKSYSAYITDTPYAPMVELYNDGNIANNYSNYFEPYYKTKDNQFDGKKICVFGDSLSASGNGGLDSWIQRVADCICR